MIKRHLPSVEALTSSDDELLITELRLSQMREQVALARTLLDEVDRLVPVSESGQALPERQEPDSAGESLTRDVAEELARLGCKMVEIASVLSRAKPANDAKFELRAVP